MKLSELPLPQNFVEKLGFSELNPPQIAAVKAGLLDRQNLVVAAPTASGKTAIAELAILSHFEAGGKVVYLSPLKALASEKYADFKRKYSDLGMRVALSIGDYDSAEDWLGRYDVIIATNEKVDSLIRHSANWLRNITLIVADEIHTMNDPGRGPTLEIVLTRLRQMTGAQILALSATISNADKIAEWLDAKLVKSNWRPIPLYKGVIYPSNKESEENEPNFSIDLTNEKQKRHYVIAGKESEPAVIEDTIQRKKQMLMFLSTRRYAEASAEKAGKTVFRFLNRDEREGLAKLSKEIESALPHPTKQCAKLARCVKAGVAFHHAGLVAKQRTAIEEGFKVGAIKVLTATPTLAMGCNLPAWRVLIRDTKRYGAYGMDYIPTLDVQQMSGRAGRPTYDTEGEAILLARSDAEADELVDRYVNAEPEPIESKLASEPILRMHTLALVATEVARSQAEIGQFFKRTFFGHQSQDFGFVQKRLEKLVAELEKWGFLEYAEAQKSVSSFSEFKPAWAMADDAQIRATRLGKRVAELYVDPLSAWTMIQNLRPITDIEALMTICDCAELRPLIRAKKAEYDEYADAVADLPIAAPEVWDVDYEDFLARLKTSLLLQAWMDEAGEEKILERFGMPPGELYNKKLSAEWMLYAGKELAMILGRKAVADSWNKLVLRVEHGVRAELLELVQLRGIGRARARLLWQNKVRSAADIKKISESDLAKIIGVKLAKSIKSEIYSKKT